ncbi:MAG: META domain-containing protein [Bacteroidetes bacterium]|nr:META domain-containing protein [Bacteroidota bacterium]
MKTVKLFLVLAIAVLMAGCSAQKPSGTTNKMQINDIWVLVKTGTKDVVKVTGRPQPMIEIHISEGRFIGNTGCNEMSGNVEVGDKTIKFSEITSTKMFCDDSPETEYLAALKKVDNWEYGKLTLYLKSGNDVLLTFKKVD